MRPHHERHQISRIGWLRAAVLGANDGIVSTASLIIGVGAASQGKDAVLLAGVAGLVAGAMSMAAGEYVSVSSQSDTEQADLAKETAELRDFPQAEHDELRDIYVARGLTPDLASQVATQMMAKDALAAHARDELGITDVHAARPIQAGLTSALTFAIGAAAPLLVAALAPLAGISWTVAGASLVFLAALGVLGARAGGAQPVKAALRVTIWGAVAMGVTAAAGSLFGAAV